MKDEDGRPRAPGYSPDWLRKVVESRPEQFKLPAEGSKETDH
jgi:hypothetical protein